jgi:AcrR family transcriptional regulator
MPSSRAKPKKTAKKKKTKPSSRMEAMQQTRQALIRAALELFAEEGLDASLDAICDRAGYTRGAFYVHFEDREALLVATMNHVGEKFLASVFQNAQGSQTFGGSVRRFVESVASGEYPLMGGTPGAALVRPHQLLDACARSSAIRDGYRGLVELAANHVASLVRAEVKDGKGRVDPDDLGMLSLALVIGTQTMSELGMAVAPRLARAFMDLVEPAIRG